MVDWMPTLAALAGATLPHGVEIDGKDLWPLLAGSGPRDPDGELRYLYYRQDNSGLGAYREGRWKLKLAVRGGESVYARYDHDDLLFDLDADPGEQNDLAPAMPEKVAELKRHMTELAAEVGLRTTLDSKFLISNSKGSRQTRSSLGKRVLGKSTKGERNSCAFHSGDRGRAPDLERSANGRRDLQPGTRDAKITFASASSAKPSEGDPHGPSHFRILRGVPPRLLAGIEWVQHVGTAADRTGEVVGGAARGAGSVAGDAAEGTGDAIRDTAEEAEEDRSTTEGRRSRTLRVRSGGRGSVEPCCDMSGVPRALLRRSSGQARPPREMPRIRRRNCGILY